MRLNGQRVDAASRAVKAGDVVTIALDRGVRVLKIVGFAERRGGAESARTLFEDLSMLVQPPEPVPAARDQGAGRPTKRERRAIDRFTEEDGR